MGWGGLSGPFLQGREGRGGEALVGRSRHLPWMVKDSDAFNKLVYFFKTQVLHEAKGGGVLLILL